MGVVYQAHDPRLDRHVAIKLLPPDLTRDETAKQRFLQEAKAASALDHPNICTIHDVGETDDGQLYLVMAHYEGDTLKDRISRGPLDLKDAVDIATQVGEGLAKAHTAGIVHRDIKPANLMVTADGTVKILDFGLAKLAGSEGVTQTGTTVGTVAYMSPEQARGQEVDHRTDIWSLGVVLYEMLAGEPPFRGENFLALSNAIAEQEQPPLAGSPSAVQPLVSQALRKDLAQRYQAVADLVGDLRKLQSAPDTPTVTTAVQADTPSIAVLPFRNMSADPEQEYFCEGMAEEIIDALAKLEGLRVVARTSAFQFKGQSPDLREVGQKLSVKTVLEGSVRKAGNRLRINAQLINAADGYHLWSERYDRELDDVFEIQDEIARSVTSHLKVRLLGKSSAPLVKPLTDNVEAYTLCLEGRFHISRATPGGFEKALACFERALAVDPDYAAAHAGIAEAKVIAAGPGLAVRAVAAEAREAALHALSLDDSVPEAHAALGVVCHLHEWRWAEAEREYRLALELNPGDTQTRGSYTLLLSNVGRFPEALGEAHAAVEQDPIALSPRLVLTLVWNAARRWENAIEAARAGLDLDPDYAPLRGALGLALIGSNRLDEALEMWQRAVALAPSATVPRASLGYTLGRVGRSDEAQTVLTELRQRWETGYAAGIDLALVCVGLRDHDQALTWLQKSADAHDATSLCFLQTLMVWDPLRDDPRFHAILRQVNFPQLAAESPSSGA